MKYHLLPLALLSAVNTAHACQFDTDCNVGSTCLKRDFSIYGVCVGGLNPGNKGDSRPVYDPLDLNRNTWDRNRDNDDGTYGDQCSFDTDCGIGSSCMKAGGGIYGTCM